MSQPPQKSFKQMREELARKRGREVPNKPPPSKAKLTSVKTFDEDLIPDVLGDNAAEDIEIEGVINGIDVLDAYRRWIGKEVDEKTANLAEGIKVSCPFPGHRDSRPSAWLNRDKKAFHCGGCDEGGDIYDIAAIHFGYERPGYKEGIKFHDLRRDMARDYGYRTKIIAGEEVVWKEEDVKPVEPPKAKKKVAPPEFERPDPDPDFDGPDDDDEITIDNSSPVSYLNDESVEDEPEEDLTYPSLDWKTIVPEGTFLREYMEECTKDDSPEEYHLFHGLMALGHAVGRNVYLDDMKYVYGNFMLCLLGGTGYGKSRSRGWLETVLEEAVPFQDTGLGTTGCKQVPVPASGENLISQFQHIAWDPSLPKGSPEVRTPVNGIVDYDEFAGLLNRAMRQGNTLKVYVQNFADNRGRITSSSNTGGTFEAYKPYCSITASTQPKAVRTLLSKYDTGSGFLNRWVFVGGPRKKRESIGGKRSGIHVNLDEAVDLLKKVRAWGAVDREVGMTDDGFKEWDTWFHSIIEPMQLSDESDLLPRLGLTLKRLLLLFAINEKRTEITKKDVRRIMPIMDYLVTCYGILNSEIGISQMSELTDEILRHIKNIENKTGRGASARDLGQRLKRKNYSPDLIKKALDTMNALDWIDVDKDTRGPGRPTVRYKAVS